MIRISELLTDFFYEEESDAAQQAKQQGLVYKGFGRWADPKTGTITHKTDGGRLVPVGTGTGGTGPPAPGDVGTKPDASTMGQPDASRMDPDPEPEPEDDFETDTPDWHNMGPEEIDDYITDLANKGDLESVKWSLEDPDLHDVIAKKIRQRSAERGYDPDDGEVEDYVEDILDRKWEDAKKVAQANKLSKKRKNYMDYEPEPGIGKGNYKDRATGYSPDPYSGGGEYH